MELRERHGEGRKRKGISYVVVLCVSIGAAWRAVLELRLERKGEAGL